MAETREVVPCPWCGKKVGFYVPAGGDETGYYLRSHNDESDGQKCLANRTNLMVDRKYVVNHVVEVAK
jgi:hypothetical protein